MHLKVWMRQRRILMPTAEIRGTHLNTSREFAEMQERIAAGHINILPPTIIAMEDVPEAHQAMWENRHAGANYVAYARSYHGPISSLETSCTALGRFATQWSVAKHSRKLKQDQQEHSDE
jgi:hypothetical protein